MERFSPPFPDRPGRSRPSELELVLASLGIGFSVVFDGDVASCPGEAPTSDRHAA